MQLLHCSVPQQKHQICYHRHCPCFHHHMLLSFACATNQVGGRFRAHACVHASNRMHLIEKPDYMYSKFQLISFSPYISVNFQMHLQHLLLFLIYLMSHSIVLHPSQTAPQYSKSEKEDQKDQVGKSFKVYCIQS